MRAIIIGGGKVGYFLVKALIERNMQVTLIEKDRERATLISAELDIDVICGDGSDISILKEANIRDTELVAAVTGSDEENLVVCQIVKIGFNHCTTIARINNPKNITMFRALGVDKTVCSTEVIANLIHAEMANERIKILQTFDMGTMILAEMLLTPEDKWVNSLVKDIHFPKHVILTTIIRSNEIIFPKGDTLLLAHDRVVLVCDQLSLIEMRDLK